MKSVVRFFSEVRTELGRIEWPGTNEFIGSTIIVLFLVVLFSLFLFGVDRAIMFCIKQIFIHFVGA